MIHFSSLFGTKQLFLVLCMVALAIISTSSLTAVNEQKVDSLLKAEKTAKHDTDKVNCLLMLSKEYRKENPDTALLFGNKAIAISTKNSDEVFLIKLAKAYVNVGVVYKNTGNTEMSLNYYNKAIQLESKIGLSEDISNAYFNAGNIYLKKKDYANATLYHKKALDVRTKIGNKKLISDSYNSLGVLYKEIGDYAKALSYYLKGIKICEYEKLKNPKNTDNINRLINFYNNTGVLYEEQKKYPVANDYQNKALNLSKQTNNVQGMISALNNLGMLKYIEYGTLLTPDLKGKLKDTTGAYLTLQASLTRYNEALQLATENQDPVSMADCFNNIANIYFSNKDFNEAIKTYNKALDMYLEVDDVNNVASTYVNLGIAYSNLKNYNLAIENGEKGLSIAKEAENPMTQKNAYISLIDAYKGIKNYQKALLYSEEYIVLKEFLLNQDQSEKLGQLKGAHDLETKQMKAAYEAKEKARKEEAALNRKNTLRTMGIFIFIVVLTLVLFFTGSYVLPQKFIDLSTFIIFLLFFEFILVLLEPIIEAGAIRSNPIYKLLLNATLALIISPVHGYLESKLKSEMIKRRAYRDRIDNTLNRIAEQE